MAGLNDLTDAAFSGGKPGPARGMDVDASSPLSAGSISEPREGASLIMDALGSDRTSRRQRAINRRINRERANGRG